MNSARRNPPWELGEQRPDIAVLVALEEEFIELQHVLSELGHDSLHDEPNEIYGTDDYLVSVEHDGGRPYRVVLHCMDDMGPSAAHGGANRLLAHQPGLIVNVGIACSLDADDLSLCDVIVANQVDAYDEKGKAADDGADGWEWRFGGEVYRPTAHVVGTVNQLRSSRRAIYDAWVDECSSDLAILTGRARDRKSVASLRRQGHLLEQPRLKKAHLASGVTVAAAKAFKDEVLDRDRNIKALEMEAAGMLRAAHDRKAEVATLVLRGISDLGDADKKQVDRIGPGAIRKAAMRNAVRLLWALMKGGRLPQVKDGAAERPRKKASKRAVRSRPALEGGAGTSAPPRARALPERLGPPSTPVDDMGLADVLAEAVDEGMAAVLLKNIRFPKAQTPRFDQPLVFWTQVVERLRAGVIKGDGVEALIRAAAKRYPGNEFFERHCTKTNSRSSGAEIPSSPTPKREVDAELRRSTTLAIVDHLTRSRDLFDRVAEGSDEWRKAASEGPEALARVMLASDSPAKLVDDVCEAISRIPPGPSAKTLADAMLDLLDRTLPVVAAPFLRMSVDGDVWRANAEFPLTMETIAANFDQRPVELHERHAPEPRPVAHVDIDAKRRPKTGANALAGVVDVVTRLEGKHDELALATRPEGRLERVVMDVLETAGQGTGDLSDKSPEKRLSLANKALPKIRGRDGRPLKLYAIAPTRGADAPADPFVAVLRGQLRALRVIEPLLGEADRELDEDLRISLGALYAAYRSLLDRTPK